MIAPSGTIGIIAGISASIEPLFALAYRRRGVLGGKTLVEVSPLLLRHLERHWPEADRLLAAVGEHGRLADVAGVAEAIRRLFVTALDILAERHLAIQAACQGHLDKSVSKTANLPREAMPPAMADVYRGAWDLGLKRITVHRYGSKGAQVLELGVAEEPHQYDHASRCDLEECRV